MAESWFLKIDGIPGESMQVKHKGEIDVESWSWGVSNSGSTSPGGGGGAGKAVFQDFHFVTKLSKATPALFLACASGSHIKEAYLTGVRAGKAGADFLKFKLGDVLVSTLQLGDSEGITPTEQFSLKFSKVEISYFPQLADGSKGPAEKAGWDLKVNKKL